MGNKDNVTELPDQRLWKLLDAMDVRLKGIEVLLTNVVRLEERMNNHENALKRYGNRLDEHALRIHETEIWQAEHGSRSASDRKLKDVKEQITDAISRIDSLEGIKDIGKGQRDIFKELLKWMVGILTAILIWKATGK